jgi:hypothetical protein
MILVIFNFRDKEYSEELEITTELSIYNATQFVKSEDLGGLTVYYNKDNELVAFFDYEMQCGHIFETETV